MLFGTWHRLLPGIMYKGTLLYPYFTTEALDKWAEGDRATAPFNSGPPSVVRLPWKQRVRVNSAVTIFDRRIMGSC